MPREPVSADFGVSFGTFAWVLVVVRIQSSPLRIKKYVRTRSFPAQTSWGGETFCGVEFCCDGMASTTCLPPCELMPVSIYVYVTLVWERTSSLVGYSVAFALTADKVQSRHFFLGVHSSSRWIFGKKFHQPTTKLSDDIDEISL